MHEEDIEIMRAEWSKLIDLHRQCATMAKLAGEQREHLGQVERLSRLVDQLDAMVAAGTMTFSRVRHPKEVNKRRKKVAAT